MRLAGWQFGDGEFTRGDASVKFGACHVSEVVTWTSIHEAGRRAKGPSISLVRSWQSSHRREERNGRNSLGSVHRNEPIKCFWNTRSPTSPCSERIALRRDLVVVDCQLAIKELDESVTNLSNLVAVEEHCGDVRFLVKGNSSVCRLPVLVVGNGGVHLLFDLTHVKSERSLFELWIQYRIPLGVSRGRRCSRCPTVHC